jgi:lipopolysaccharide/colanic/teichoic acid biosynthesis glycosyltransferase
MTKRVFDIVLSLSLLALFSPIMIATALAIVVTSGTPVFYRSRRVGRSAKSFNMLKFRTMVPNAEVQGKATRNKDPRITRLGRILRDYKLDEFPQFLNVVKGDMSIVGPRPEFSDFTRLFQDNERIILEVRPGITDWASLKFRDLDKILSAADDPEKYYVEVILPEKNRLRIRYVKEHSFWIDVEIILRTIASLFRRKN